MPYGARRGSNLNWLFLVTRSQRVIGSIRRECTDHIIALGERHLLRTILKYQAYYNEARCHMSLDATRPRLDPSKTVAGAGVATPHLGGLHHRYGRAA